MATLPAKTRLPTVVTFRGTYTPWHEVRNMIKGLQCRLTGCNVQMIQLAAKVNAYRARRVTLSGTDETRFNRVSCTVCHLNAIRFVNIFETGMSVSSASGACHICSSNRAICIHLSVRTPFLDCFSSEAIFAVMSKMM